MNLQIGDQASNFVLPDQTGKEHSLASYLGQWVVLYFYPQDDTPGCTTEACSIRDHYADLKQQAVILGVSVDSVESHEQFTKKYNLPFTLLADQKKEVREQYGAKGPLGTKRITFIIDPAGNIAKIYPKVSPAEHAVEMLQDLKQLQAK